jgi:rhodanese-related sulfurtransferase
LLALSDRRQENLVPTRINRDELQRRLAPIGRPVLVEALGAAFYGDAHLPGAINIPPAQVDRLAEQLIPDRDSPVVVYCSGSCSSAEAVAGRLEAVGYTDVAVYVGGKEDWVEHGLPVERSDAFDSEGSPTAADELQ